MRTPIAVARIKIHESGQKKISLWLPIFILWPLALLLLIVVAPICLLIAPRRTSALVPELYRLACALSGTEIAIENSKSNIQIYVH